MRANRKATIHCAEDAQMGIGTLIIFISMVLVSAVAAAVLISTSGILQERATDTGKEATESVATNLKVVQTSGSRPTAYNHTLEDISMRITVSAGSRQIDLSQVAINIIDGITSVDLTYSNSTANATKFNITVLRDEDGSFSAQYPIINSGDLVEVLIDADAAGLVIDPRTNVQMFIVPEIGNPVLHKFRTPSSYGLNLQISL
ncbi:MAG: archaellin/type IV pilin N-terminal domain-containing protein [Halobacteriota archaeon]|nr:archaellin/type IV pilin N-terminal domain-containing protein [Halobacteriota archaeon]